MDNNTIFSIGDAVAPGGPSAPAWAFFTAITLGILTIIGQQLKARHDAKLAKVAALAAASNAEQAVKNTTSTSNGFAHRVDSKLDGIGARLSSIEEDLRNHMEWHLNNPTQKDR